MDPDNCLSTTPDQVTHPSSSVAQPGMNKKLVGNTAYLVASQLISQLSVALVGIIIARSLGQAGYGQYTLAFAFVTAIGALFSMGSESILVREVAQNPHRSGLYFGNGLWLRMLNFPLAVLIILLAAIILRYSPDQRLIIFLSAVFLGISAASDLPRAIFIGSQRMSFEFFSRVGEKVFVLLVILIAVFPLNLRNLSWILVGAISSALIGFAFSVWLVKRHVGSLPQVSLASSAWLWRASAPLAGSIVLISIYVQLPAIILSKFVTIEQIGLYNAAFNLINPFSLLATAFASATLPVLSAIARASRANASRTYTHFFGYNLVLGLPFALLLQWFGKDLITLLYGEAFLPAAPTLGILAWYLPTVFLNMYLLNAMVSVGDQALSVWINLVNLLFTLLLGAFLISRNGIIGAALTVLITAFISLSLKIIFISKKFSFHWNPAFILTILASLGLLIACTLLTAQPLWIQIILCGNLYAILIIASGVINLQQLKSVLSTRINRV